MSTAERDYEVAKKAAIQAVKADPNIDSDAPGFGPGFIEGFRAAWQSATPAPVQTQEKGDQ